jgi:cytochrome oxidase Cu insertion factor (SCO1/SenC/PrrC family)
MTERNRSRREGAPRQKARPGRVRPRARARRAGLLTILVALLALVPASLARADGDPASDVLLTQAMFVPADVSASSQQQSQLASLLHAAKQAGFPIRVAVIQSDYDLGSVTSLWLKPRLYAEFLGVELSTVYKGALLVVMPDGFGLNLPGHSTSAAYARFARIATGSRGSQLLSGADAAVTALAAVEGTNLGTPGARPGGGGAIAAAIAAALALLALVLLRRRAVALAGALGRRIAALRPRPASRLVVLNVALGVAVAGAGTIVGLQLSRGSSAPKQSAAQQATQVAPFKFAAHQHLAPTFRLTDQNGRPLSLSGFHGKPVILTFIDPLCRNLCPLAAHVLNQLDRELPPAQRVPIIAVSVDIYADTHADLLQDYRRWSLVPQWHWAIGTPAQLKAVWHDYGIGVVVQTKHIAGTTVHFISHYEVAYVVDPQGYARALYFWPYSVASVAHTIAQVARS